jgi:hypothetical protein
MIPLGIFGSAGAGLTDYDLIESVILTGTTASVTFSNLGDYSSIYKHLQIRAVVRGTNASNSVNASVRINGDTGSNYSEHGFYAGGVTPTGYGTANTTSMYFGTIPANNYTASVFCGTVIDLLDAYSTTKHKTIKFTTGYQAQVGFGSGQRRNTESTTSVTLLTTGSWATDSRFSIYGIRG